MVQVHPTSKYFVSGENSNNHTSNVLFEANKNYHVKMILDVQNKKLDYYINNVKANTNPIDIASNYYTDLNWFGIYNGAGTVYYDNMKFYVTNNLSHTISKGTETNGTFTIDKSSAELGEIITITSVPSSGYRVKSVKVNDNDTGVTEESTNNYKFAMLNTNVKVDVEFEKIPYTITFNSVTGVNFDKTSPITVEHGDDEEITITANTGYRLTSVKVNGVEQTLPLVSNKLTLIDVTVDQTIIVAVEEIEYEVTDGDGQTHTIGTDTDGVFEINADHTLFNKVYLNGEELDSANYTISEGSTIITLNQAFLNRLETGTYNLRATFTDGGEANTTFVIAELVEDNPKTDDSILNSIILGSVSLIGLIGAGLYIKKKIINER